MIQKKSLTLVTTGLIVTAFALVGCEKKLDNDMRKASYAIGQQIGQNLKNQNIEFDAEVVAMSMKDASTGKASKLKPEEMQQALQKLQEGINKKQMEAAEANGSEGKKFLEKNKSEPNVKTTASGLQYIVVTEGTGKTPTANDNVKAHYTGTLTNGQKFDSSIDRGQPAEFPVSGVIKGWTEALMMMKKGGKMKLFIPPELGYGPQARPGIPANSVLVFDVELIDVLPAKAAAPAGKPAKK
jgi:FKBP-type peptidyl-prolyl cis-trans isomerase FkpA/FKBP-type peptidyl-prolyl cis-trans isomerase FklB